MSEEHLRRKAELHRGNPKCCWLCALKQANTMEPGKPSGRRPAIKCRIDDDIMRPVGRALGQERSACERVHVPLECKRSGAEKFNLSEPRDNHLVGKVSRQGRKHMARAEVAREEREVQRGWGSGQQRHAAAKGKLQCSAIQP